MSKKPLIYYIDDESHNLTVFEACLLPEWEIKTFDSPLKALDEITKDDPWIVVSDQRMPGMVGVNFLEIVKKTHPFAKRVIVTGYSDEDLIVESVRKAQICDYIRKPWDSDDLIHRMTKLIEVYKLENDIREKTSILEKQNNELKTISDDLKFAKDREEKLRRELEAWAPPFISGTIGNDFSMQFPKKANLAVMTYDIIQSSKLHGIEYHNRPIHAHILDGYTQTIIRHGGWRESSSGDSAYAHFGIIKELKSPANSAFAAATEFRVFLRNLSQVSGVEFECGIAIHFAPECTVDIHEIKVQAFGQDVIHKSFQSSSIEIDLVHRMEKLMHELPGTNIAMSKAFVDKLDVKLEGIIDLGPFQLKGQSQSVNLLIKPSYFTKENDVIKLKNNNNFSEVKIAS